MVLLLPAVILNQWINDFSTHQASPARHPNLATRGHVHKVIHNHGSLASWALHRSNLLQQVVSLSIGEDIYQDFSDEAETALPNPSFARK
jgi:hypothetical protein